MTATRRLACAGALFLAGAALPATASAVAQVNLLQGTLTVAVVPAGDDIDRHGLFVEPFQDSGRDGWRVRQLAFGDARIADGGLGACEENIVFNDVVCSGARDALTVTGGPGRDRVTIVESQAAGATDTGALLPPAGDVSCLESPDSQPAVTVNLGAGNDRFVFGTVDACPAGLFTSPGVVPRSVTVRGGEGADELLGGDFAETLFGGPRGDTVRGGRGDDTLLGDTAGEPFGGPDILDGGPGNDTVSYAGVALRVGVIIGDGVALDGTLGPVSEGDEVTASVENVIGGGASDAIVGTGGPNRLTGAGGDDNLSGMGGADVLDGGVGGDTLSGGPGLDVFLPGPGNDVVDARDGNAETFDCGDGQDTAFVDLQDGRSRLSRFIPLLPGCESVLSFAVDDGPPARIVAGTVRRRAGVVPVRLACPSDARVDCRGRLRLRARSLTGRLLGTAAYRVRRGRHDVIAVPVAGAVPRVVVALTTERGVSRRGPRRTVRVLVHRP